MNFQLPSQILVRTPRRSVEELTKLRDEINSQPLGLALLKLLASPDLQSALATASVDIAHHIRQITAGGDFSTPLQHTIWRYLVRMSTRSTPFGELAGIGLSPVRKSLAVPASLRFTRFDRLDSSLLSHLVEVITSDSATRTQLSYSLNDSLYPVGNQYRFSRRLAEGQGQQVRLSACQSSEPIERLMAYFSTHPCISWSALVAYLENFYETRSIAPFLETLIEENFLVSELQLPITGRSAHQFLQAKLKHINHPIGTWLGQALTGQSLNAYSLQISLQPLLPKEAALPTSKEWVQSDTWLATLPSVDPFFLRAILSDLEQLRRLLTRHTPDKLTEFARRFRNRFEDQAVPLLAVLDSSLGLGYSGVDRMENAWLNQLPQPVNEFPQADPRRQRIIDQVYSHASLHKAYALDLVPFLKNWDRVLPSTIEYQPSSYLLGELFVSTDPKEPFLFHCKALWGPSATPLMGRFCYMSDALTEFVRGIHQQEQAMYPNQTLAEIVHFSANRAGNILARPVLRTYEIPYLTTAGVEPAAQIPLGVISVAVSPDLTVRLVDTRTGTQLLPRLTSAHNTDLGDEVYSFLADVMNQARTALRWDWTTYKETPFLPRLTYNRILLSRARWYLHADRHLSPITNLQELIDRYQLPSTVTTMDGDQELVLQLESEPARNYLWNLFCRQEGITLYEWLPGTLANTHRPWCQTQEGTYVSEWIVPLLTKQGRPELPPSVPQSVVKQQPIRTHFPDGEWLYLKIYANYDVFDSLLLALVPIFNASLTGFFVRYADPAPHLRLRWKGHRQSHRQVYTRCLRYLKPYLEATLIYRIEVSTYERELERYTPELITFCEDLFTTDTRLYLEWLKQSTSQLPSDTERYKRACHTILGFLDWLALTLDEQISLFSHLQQAFLAEQSEEVETKKALNKLYREHSDHLFEPAQQQLVCQKWEQCYPQSEMLNASKQRLAGQPAVVASILHMSLNRLFITEPRQQELIVYHFLLRQLTTRKARQQTGSDTNPGLPL